MGLDCALPILRKQAAYILRLRMQHTLAPVGALPVCILALKLPAQQVARGEAKASLSAVARSIVDGRPLSNWPVLITQDFSIDQWEAFLVLYETLQSVSCIPRHSPKGF